MIYIPLKQTTMNFEEMTDEQLLAVEKKVAELKQRRMYSGFKTPIVDFEVGLYDEFRFVTCSHSLFQRRKGTHELFTASKYQFLVDAALRKSGNKSLVIKNVLDYMIQILQGIRSGIKE